MVWSDVEQDGHIGTELIHIVELETAQDVYKRQPFAISEGWNCMPIRENQREAPLVD